MNFFEEATLRLKQQLRVTEDKQAAEALGMTGNAWTMRKRRDAFPEKELRALAQQRPELGIDVEFVLTGGTLTAHQKQIQDTALHVTQSQPDSKAHLLELLGKAGVAMAITNARRADTYRQITEVLNMCSDDTVALVQQLVVKLYRAELGEKMQARETDK